MKILSWNIRGLKKLEKRRRLKSLIKEKKVDMLFLQESKQGTISKEFIKTIWWNDDFDFLDVEASGTAGGLICIWNIKSFNLMESVGSRNFLILKGTFNQSFNCVVTNVYCPCCVVKRRKLWTSLIELKNNFPEPWCIGGDLNEIRFESER